MRITNLCLNGPVTDGWNYQDNLLPKYQKQNGNEVTIITSHWVWGTDGELKKDERDEYINEDGVRVIRLSIHNGKAFGYRFRKYDDLYETIERTNPDILFIHGVSCVDDKIIAKYLKTHKNVVAYADNHADFSNSGTNFISKYFLHGIIWRYYAHFLVPYVGKFYGVLPVRVEFLNKTYRIPKEKCELLVLGADDELVENAKRSGGREIVRKQLNINDDDFLVITGGKIDMAKTQILLLMEAVKKIDNKRVKLVIFGSVDDGIKDRFNGLVDDDKVRYIGWVDTKKSYDIFSSADLVVFPGRHSVFWEQVAAQGIPMLCKDWPGTHHVDVGGNVEFLCKDSVDLIQQKIEELVNDQKKYQNMKMIAQQKGAVVFSYKNIAMRSITNNSELI